MICDIAAPMMAQQRMPRQASEGRQGAFKRTELGRKKRQVRFVSVPARAVYAASHECGRQQIYDTNPELWRISVTRTA